MAKSKWAYIEFYINVVLNIKKVLNILQDSIVLIKRERSDLVYESDSEEDEDSRPKRLDKGKGKATEEDERSRSESLDKGKGKATEEDENENESWWSKAWDKGKGKATEENENEGSWWSKPWGKAIPENEDESSSSGSRTWVKRPLDKGKAIEEAAEIKEATEIKENSDTNNSGSDIDTDEELNEDLRDEIEFLTHEPKTKDNISRLITLRKLLRNELQKKGPLPPLPDHWNHWSKPPVDKNTSKESQLTTNPTQATSDQNVVASPSNTNLNADFDNKPREIDKNVRESSTPATVTQSTPGTVTQSSETSEKPKQTPTEYVHELESTEPTSYGWDDGD